MTAIPWWNLGEDIGFKFLKCALFLVVKKKKKNPQDVVQVLLQVYMPTYDLVGLSSLFHTSPLGHNSNNKTHSRWIHTESFRPDTGGVVLFLRLHGESTEHSKVTLGRK